MKYQGLFALGLCAVLFITILYTAKAPPRAEIPEAPPIEPRVASEDEAYIKIGFYGSLTGAASVLGQMGQQGCRLAVDQINNDGGINGKKIRLIEYDDQTDQKSAEDVVRKLITEDRVDAIIGSHTSSNVARTAPLTEQAQVLQIGLGTSFIWEGSYQYLFRSTGNSAIYDIAIFEALRAADHQRIAIYYDSTEYAQAGAAKLTEYILHDPDMQVEWSRSYDIAQTDFLTDLQSMVQTAPDAVILYTFSENAGIQLKQLREKAGFGGIVYAPEIFAASTTRKEAGTSLTGLVFACTNMIPNSPSHAFSAKEQAFLESFIKMYGTMPVSDTAYRGYDAMMILAETFRSAESMDSEDLRQTLLDLTDYEGVSGVFDFSDGSGDGLHSCRVVTVTDPDHIEMAEYFQPY